MKGVSGNVKSDGERFGLGVGNEENPCPACAIALVVKR